MELTELTGRDAIEAGLLPEEIKPNAQDKPEVAPDAEGGKQDAEDTAGNAGTKGQAEGAPKGQAEPAPESTEKQTEPTEAAKEYTKEEIAELEKRATSYDEAQKLMTKATMREKELERRVAELEAVNRRPQTEEEYVNEALRDAKFISALEKKGYTADSFFDENGLLTKNVAIFGREREAYLSEQRAVENTVQSAISKRVEEINGTFDELAKEHGEAFNGVADKVVAYIQEKYSPDYIRAMPGDEVRDFIHRAVRAIDPKLLERADMAKEAAAVEARRKAAVESTTTAQPKNPKGSNKARLAELLNKYRETQDAEDWVAYRTALAEAKENNT